MKLRCCSTKALSTASIPMTSISLFVASTPSTSSAIRAVSVSKLSKSNSDRRKSRCFFCSSPHNALASLMRSSSFFPVCHSDWNCATNPASSPELVGAGIGTAVSAGMSVEVGAGGRVLAGSAVDGIAGEGSGPEQASTSREGWKWRRLG